MKGSIRPFGNQAIQSLDDRATVGRLQSRVARLTQQLAELARENADLQREVGELRAFRELAFVDPVTELPNRHYFERRLAEEICRARRDGRPLSLLLIDVDLMKQINDCFGHLAGDRLLKEVARQAAANLRSHDALCRIGGDEFAALLPGANAGQARKLAARLRDAVRPRGSWGCGTISAGAATLDGAHDTQEALFVRADEDLYRVKAERRTRSHRRRQGCHEAGDRPQNCSSAA